ncbi:MAG: hypothetical protein SGI74_05015 [Oligoflexia bacterium]|nr:hypothetical protein [Oligoflexia bacterium]
MKIHSFKRFLTFSAGLSIVVGFVIGCGNNHNPQVGVEGSDSKSGDMYKKQAEAKIKVDPRAVAEMLYQGLLWRSMDLPGAQGYIDLIASKGLEGVVEAAVQIINDPNSREFKTNIETKTYIHSGDRQILERMTSYFFGSLPREDRYVNDYKKYLEKIRKGRSDEVVKELFKDIRFYRRFTYFSPTIPSTQTNTVPQITINPEPTGVIWQKPNR